MSRLETILTEITKSNPFSFFAPATPSTSNLPKSTKSRRSSVSSKAQKSGPSTRESSREKDEKGKKRRSTISVVSAKAKASDGTKTGEKMEEGSTEVTAVVLHGPKDLRIEKHILPPPAENEVRIRIGCTTLCDSDLHYYTSFLNGSIPVQHSFILGHRSCGYITTLGSGVNRPSSAGGLHSQHNQLAVGDLVAVEPGISCATCSLCLSGRSNLCASLRSRSTAKPPLPHLVSEINHPASHVFKLPSSMSPELGVLIQPLAVAMHAHSRAKLPCGSTMLVLGAGAIGLLVAAVGRSRGLKVVVADLIEERVRFATRWGFAEKGVVVPSLPPAKTMEEKLQASRDLAQQIADAHLAGAEEERVGCVDAVFECTGSESALQAAIYAAKSGGKILVIGMGNKVQTLPIAEAALREVDLLGVCGYAGYADAVGLAGSGDPSLPDLERLVTHKITGVENVEEVFRLSGAKGCIKAAFYWE